MSGYLYFKRTGHKEVDDIIWEIEQAGDSYHHTSQWDESSKLNDGTIEPSWIDRINEKILIAKKALEDKAT